MIDKDKHSYILQVFEHFLKLAKLYDPEYFNDIPEDKFHIIYLNDDSVYSQKAQSLFATNRDLLSKPLFAPFDYSFYCFSSVRVLSEGEHPEAPTIYLDGFLIDNTIPEIQKIHLLLGDNVNNNSFIISFERFPDGRSQLIVNEEKTVEMTTALMTKAEMWAGAISFVASKARKIKEKSPINLYQFIY